MIPGTALKYSLLQAAEATKPHLNRPQHEAVYWSLCFCRMFLGTLARAKPQTPPNQFSGGGSVPGQRAQGLATRRVKGCRFGELGCCLPVSPLQRSFPRKRLEKDLQKPSLIPS